MLLLDGATATELQRRGLPVRPPWWTTAALLSGRGRALLRAVHSDYVRAGAALVTANTFRCNLRALLAALLCGAVQTGGGSAIVNATGWIASDGYEVVAVPSTRMVMDLFDWDASRWIITTGASGHAFSGHYVDQAGRWAEGRAVPMRWTPDAVRAGAVDHLVLTPSQDTG